MKSGPVLRVAVACVYAFLMAPVLFVVAISFSGEIFISFPPASWSLRWYVAMWQHAGMMAAMRASLVTATLVMGISLVLGGAAAFALARGNFRGRETLQGLFVAPLVLPTIVIGLGLLLVFTRAGLIATYPGLVLGHLVVTLPFTVRILTTAFANVPADVEDAAATLGASPWRSFRRITLPLVTPGLIAAAALSFLISFDETVITLFVSGPRLSTLPAEMFRYVERRTDPMIASISVVLIAATVAVVLLVERMVGVMRAVGR